MCYSAQIYSDFRKYQRLGGKLDIDAYVKLAGWTKAKGIWIKLVPKSTRIALLEVSEQPEFQDEHGALLFHAVSDAEVSAIADLDAEVAKQEQRIADAEAKLASARPTKAAEKELSAAKKKRDDALEKIESEKRLVEPRETERIYPGHFAPVLIRDPATGERMVVPMRYRCRLPACLAGLRPWSVSNRAPTTPAGTNCRPCGSSSSAITTASSRPTISTRACRFTASSSATWCPASATSPSRSASPPTHRKRCT